MSIFIIDFSIEVNLSTLPVISNEEEDKKCESHESFPEILIRYQPFFSSVLIFFLESLSESILILLILMSVKIPGISYDPLCQWIIHNIFRIQTGIITKSIRVGCCMGYIHYASVLSGMVTTSMFDDQFLWNVKESLGVYIPKLTKRSRNRLFIFLLLMEDNPSKKPRKEMKVFTQWFRVRGIFFLLYGYVDIIVEDWRRFYLYWMNHYIGF